MKNPILTLAAIISLASFSAYSHADNMSNSDAAENGIYVGANYGYLKVDGDDDFDDNSDVMQGLVGYKFNKYLALEGSYINFGDYGNGLANAETDGYTAALKVMFPIVDRVELYAKAGQLWYSTDYKVVGFSGNKDDEGVFAGAGVAFKVTDRFLINAEYTWYDAEINADNVANGANTETDFKQASLGVEYRF
ncbi:porin family protein [Shewanella sp. SW36]|uniref:porin family protein n=1 Tax=Shewanella TaxID=22 RepID=UPI0021DB15EC|nr:MULTISPECIES: porin family protein [unclassified Shewanella]MCU7975052.1 porin family protein [Shewanella sp. SW36]MCU7987077.1 porin family protein [Shewanella sp. SW24]MCU7990441.1 porin family protein [Shewanella sp. SW1]MCU8016108.1 porin family protein [Shewanella sp. SM72]MCU8036683.1 porin family protein [Shewanella sp. SM71]